VLSRETKAKTKPMSERKTVQPGVREISPVSIRLVPVAGSMQT